MNPENPANKPTDPWRERLRGLLGGVKIRWWQVFLGIGVSVLFLWLAFRDVPLTQIAATLGDLNWGFVALALAVSVASTVTRAARWQLLYYPDHRQRKLLHLSGVLFISQMLNVLIPLRVGEVARLILMHPLSATRTLGTVAVEKLLDLLTLLAFLLILPFSISLPAWFRESSQGFILLALLLFGLTLLLYFTKEKLLAWLTAVLRFLPEGWRDKLHHSLLQTLISLNVFKDWRFGLKVSGWSFLTWGIGVLVNYFLFRAFQLSLPVSAALFLLLVLQVGIAVPSIPGKLGVFQYMTIVALGVFGVGKGLGLSYSLVLYLVYFGPHLFLGPLFGVLEWNRARRRLGESDKERELGQ